MGWKYYNHALIPDDPPHKNIDITAIKNGSIWKMCVGGGIRY